VQINTGVGCHLDAALVGTALEELDPPIGSVVFVENVGNLVCPALFDLGERAKVVVCSTPEGDDKPLKYPHMFQTASLVLLNKIDLLEHVPFSLENFTLAVAKQSPRATVMHVSAWKGQGMGDFYGWLS